MRWNVQRALAALFLSALLLTGCSVDHPASPKLAPLQGSGYLAKYVAIGGSVTAGFMDAGLIIDGQLDSYPSLIARQLGLVVEPLDEAEFTQPYVAPPGLGSTEVPAGMAAGVLYWNGSTIDLSGMYPLANVPDKLLLRLSPVPYSNLAVPGATVYDALHAIDGATSLTGENSYFDAILRNPNFGNTTMVQQAAGPGPTLVTIWLGVSDVQFGAMSGRPQIGINPAAGDNITPPAAFAAMYDEMLTDLIEGIEAASGQTPNIVIGNIPDITAYPYFVNEALFAGLYPFGYEEDDVSRVLFPALQWIQEPGNVGQAVPDSLTLTQTEVATIQQAVDGYNEAIDQILSDRSAGERLIAVDLHAALATLDPTQMTHFFFLVQGGADVQTAAATTVFSLDGLHFNNRGQGVLANLFLPAINQGAGTNVAEVDVSELSWDPTHGLD
jgi:lysophospholipase L1-like esterase